MVASLSNKYDVLMQDGLTIFGHYYRKSISVLVFWPTFLCFPNEVDEPAERRYHMEND
jgi:hypothetical protein